MAKLKELLDNLYNGGKISTGNGEFIYLTKMCVKDSTEDIRGAILSDDEIESSNWHPLIFGKLI